MMDGIVRQLDSIGGVVVECTCVQKCIESNQELVEAVKNQQWDKVKSGMAGCKVKNCLLSVTDHGNRCAAWPGDTTTWIIDTDMSKIKQIMR